MYASERAEDISYDSDLCYNFTSHIILARHVRQRPWRWMVTRVYAITTTIVREPVDVMDSCDLSE